MLAIAAGVMSVYAILYLLPGSSFNVNGSERCLSVLEALYFSGITFTTIGYGDISPNGHMRFLAVSEGLFGIAVSSALVVSFVRRYVE